MLNDELSTFLKSRGAALIGFANLHEIPPYVRENLPFGLSIAVALDPYIVAGIVPDYAREILMIIKNEERQRKIRKGEIPPTTGLLSEREMEVLQLVADGLTNQ